MMVHTYDAGGKSARPHDCGCGCGSQCGCESRCCELECLVRPNFFCGQLLTDADLGAMVEWARKRFALTRYRHGWGVVCGLDVTCSAPHGSQSCCPDPNAGPTVYVNPGYAIDCCGNDLVVCEPIAVDLSKVCRPPQKPCDEVPKEQKDAAGKTGGPKSTEGNGQQTVPPNCWDMLSTGLVAVDLTLRYHEDLAQGQRPMFRSGCSDVGPCEYTRVLEHPCVYPKLVEHDCPGPDGAWQVWDDKFTKRRDPVWAEITEATKAGAETVLRYLRHHPPHRFCFLEEFVCCLFRQKDQAQVASTLQTRVAFWLYFDWLLHELECPCWSCRLDSGVPIARVLLRRVEQECRVMLIDTSAPYRRLLRRDECRPLPRGAIDLAPYLWQSLDAARDQLVRLGVAVGEDVLGEDNLQSIVREGHLYLAPGQRLKTVAVEDPLDPQHCTRIAGFASAPS
jgi:hypothetical protein